MRPEAAHEQVTRALRRLEHLQAVVVARGIGKRSGAATLRLSEGDADGIAHVAVAAV